MLLILVLALNSLVQGGKCSRPSVPACDEKQSEQTCSSTPGCAWKDESDSCSGPENECMAASTQNTCTAITNCAWDATREHCNRPSIEECSAHTQQTCIPSSGCFWQTATNVCAPPDTSQCGIKTQAECNAEDSGCEWVTYDGQCQDMEAEECDNLSPSACNGKVGCGWNHGDCRVTVCDGLSPTDCEVNGEYCEYISPPPGKCTEPPVVNIDICRNLSPNVCATTDGCSFQEDVFTCSSTDSSVECNDEVDEEGCSSHESCSWVLWIVGSCYSASSIYYDCYDNDNVSDCSDDSSPECIWNPNYYSGECHVKEEVNELCFNNNTNTGCAVTSVSTGICSFQEGLCGVKGYFCAEDDDGGKCSTDSTDNGCVWKAAFGACHESGKERCYKNAAGNDCEEGTSTSCTFQSQPAGCLPNYNLNCHTNSEHTGCAAPSDGCKWIAGAGECYDNLTCYRNVGNTGCDTTASDVGCTWKGSACTFYDQPCLANVGNDGCSETSTLAGCVWDPEDSSANVHIPVLLLVVLLVLGL